MDIFSCEQVGWQLGGQPILRNISFSLPAGGFLGVTGPSGSGKSSLFRLMNRLASPTQGRLLYKGQEVASYPVTTLRRQIGYVLQKPYLFGDTVRENLEYPYTVWKLKPEEAVIKQYLERVNLPTAVLSKSEHELSGGEQQRIALVRSLLAKPEIVLLDEVTAALDEENTLLLEELLAYEQQQRPLTICLITHSSAQLRRLSQQVLYIEAGCGTFYATAADFFARGEVT